MVRAAQQAGDLSGMYPEGATRVSHIPWFLQEALQHALTVLNWMENLPKKELPPRHIWADAEGLDLWWKKLEELRADGLPDASGATPDGDSAGTGNDLAAAFKAGR